MVPKFERLDDLRLNSLNLEVRCPKCGHIGIVEGAKLWRWFALHRWNTAADKIAEHLRCSVCDCRPTTMGATSEPPTITFGPSSPDEWEAAVRRIGRR